MTKSQNSVQTCKRLLQLRVQNAAVGNKVSKLLVTVQCVEFFLLKKVQYDQGRSNFFCFGGTSNDMGRLW